MKVIYTWLVTALWYVGIPYICICNFLYLVKHLKHCCSSLILIALFFVITYHRWNDLPNVVLNFKLTVQLAKKLGVNGYGYGFFLHTRLCQVIKSEINPYKTSSRVQKRQSTNIIQLTGPTLLCAFCLSWVFFFY